MPPSTKHDRSTAASSQGKSSHDMSTAAGSHGRSATTETTYGNYANYYGYRYKDAVPQQQYCPCGAETPSRCRLCTVPAYYAHLDDRLRFFCGGSGGSGGGSGSGGWFTGKRVLDVGCNAGAVSIQVARDMGAASVLGIDRDETLVKKARAALATTFSQTQPVRSGERNGGATAASYSIISDTTSQHGVVIDSMDEEEGGDGVPIGASLLGPRWSVGRTPCASTTTVAVATTDAEARNEGDTAMTASTLAPAPHGHVNVHHFPISMPLLFGRIPWSQHPPVHVRETYPHNVVFETCDIVRGLPGDERVLVGREFDVILALSVTKWIHVHYGDAGMLTFFQRCHDLLAPGGHLLLEPQPWSGYSKLLTASGASVYQVDGPALRLRPGEDGESDNVGTTTFDAVLQQCGFEPGRAVHEPVAASSGFAQRRLWLYRRTS